jgi:hypothetical protein
METALTDRYFVTAVRKSKGVYTDEGSTRMRPLLSLGWQNLARIRIA